MINWFKRIFLKQASPRNPVIVENIGPDAPKIKIAAKIKSYTSVSNSSSGGHIIIMLEIGNATVQAPVPVSIQKHYPIGTDICLLVEKR